MRTPTLVAVTAAASAALAAPLAIVVHDGTGFLNAGTVAQSLASGANGASGTVGSGSTGTGSSSGAGSQAQGDQSQGTQAQGGTTSSSGTSTTATASQSKGVVMIDTVLSNGEAAGTGMVLTSDGTVLTNYHVVAGSTQIRVTVPGGTSYTAKVVGHDETHDVAVLKLTGAKNLSKVTLDTDGVKQAEQILAVGQGNGEGVLYAATGTVTATGRSITASEQGSLSSGEDLTNLIQTNAAIVGGYSGGPLFDASGKVVGIDTAASASNSLTGYAKNAPEGYAIPIAQAKSIADTILAGTKTATNHIGARAALGIGVTPSSSTSAGGSTGMGGYGSGQGGATTSSGVVVQQVLSGSPTAAAGLSAGDTLTALGSTKISTTDDLSKVMDTQYPGASMKVTWTDTSGTSHTATVKLTTATTN